MNKLVLDVDDAVNIVINICREGKALNKDSIREEFQSNAYTLGSDYRVGFCDGFDAAKDSIKRYVNNLVAKRDMGE